MRSLNGRRIRSFAIRTPMLQLFSNTAAHLQPACSQHAASMQPACSTTAACRTTENQSTLSRNTTTTLQLERKSTHTLTNGHVLHLPYHYSLLHARHCVSFPSHDTPIVQSPTRWGWERQATCLHWSDHINIFSFMYMAVSHIGNLYMDHDTECTEKLGSYTIGDDGSRCMLSDERSVSCTLHATS